MNKKTVRRWSIQAVKECERRMQPPENATVAQLASEWGLTYKALQGRLYRAGVRTGERRGAQRGGKQFSREKLAIIRTVIARVNTAEGLGSETWDGLARELGWPTRAQKRGRALRQAVKWYCAKEELPMPKVGRGRWG